jgi:TPR repeat protein
MFKQYTDGLKGYEYEQRGDYVAARICYEQAIADVANLIARRSLLNNLGLLYCHGLGTVQDYAKARKCWDQAIPSNRLITSLIARGRCTQASQNAAIRCALYNLGWLYCLGLGMVNDYLLQQWLPKWRPRVLWYRLQQKISQVVNKFIFRSFLCY